MKSSLFRLTLIVSLLAVSAAGQTQIDLRTQAKDVDFSGASSTKPIQTGTSLPAVCALGQTFLLTNASLGQNLYMCTAANVWTRQGGAAMLAQLADFTATYTNAQTLAIAANCTTATPCNLRIGTTVYSFTQGCTATLAGGTGTAFIYFDSTGALTIGHELTLSASAECVAQSGISNFPPGSIPLFTWSAVDGAWDTAGGTDYRAMLATKGIAATTGLLTVREFGVGVALAVTLDAFLVRPVLLPAAVEALGQRAWWPTRVGCTELRIDEQQSAPMSSACNDRSVVVVPSGHANSLADTNFPGPTEEEIR